MVRLSSTECLSSISGARPSMAPPRNRSGSARPSSCLFLVMLVSAPSAPTTASSLAFSAPTDPALIESRSRCFVSILGLAGGLFAAEATFDLPQPLVQLPPPPPEPIALLVLPLFSDLPNPNAQLDFLRGGNSGRSSVVDWLSAGLPASLMLAVSVEARGTSVRVVVVRETESVGPCPSSPTHTTWTIPVLTNRHNSHVALRRSRHQPVLQSGYDLLLSFSFSDDPTSVGFAILKM